MTAELSTYFDSFAVNERRHKAGCGAWLPELRRAAMARFGELGFPSAKHEDWKYTNVSGISRVPFRPAERLEPDDRALEEMGRLGTMLPRGSNGRLLVFVNGRYLPGHSAPGAPVSGLHLGSLSAALGDDPDAIAENLGRQAAYRDHPFTALNTAFLEDGAFVRLEPGTVVSEPICLLFVTSPGVRPTVVHPRNLVLAGAGSRATIVEAYGGCGPGAYFTNAVTELALERGAAVEHYKLQHEARTAFHVGRLQVSQGRESRFTGHSIALGGALARNDTGAVMEDEGAECTLNGLYMVGSRQLVDNHTVIDHAKPRCTSRETYKGVLDGASRAVFNGKVLVRPDAQKSDATQDNRNLLLSREAIVDTKPQLEIFADDVKCAHGATVGQLDDDALFYLRSRGIGASEARALLTYAFASEIVDRVTLEPLRLALQSRVRDWLTTGQN